MLALPMSANLRAVGRGGGRRAPMLIALTALAVTLSLGWWMARTSPGPSLAAQRASSAAPFTIDPRLLDPRPSGQGATFTVLIAAKLPAAEFRSPTSEPATTGSLSSGRPVMLSPSITASAIATTPLPVPRPADLQGTAVAGRAKPRRLRSTGLVAPAEDTRSFFEKLFGGEPTPTTAYASLPSGPRIGEADPRAKPAPAMGVAVYDIDARVVTLPNGERLEAHSGYGENLDDPRTVHLRMRGATPPGTYDLTERENLFHGVRALRLNPVGGSGAVHGRAGLLAHTFMLGPRGDSNGCVSFRDYDRFLQAYLRGDVRRLVVVSGSRWGGPTIAATLFGGAG